MKLILSRMLQEQDLTVWAQLKAQFFEPPYSAIYGQITKFYNEYDKLPSFEELELSIRDDNTKVLVQTLHEVEVPEELDTNILLSSLINTYAQNEVLHNMQTLLDDIVFMTADGMVERLTENAINLAEKTDSQEQIVSMGDFKTYDEDELKAFTPLGISNAFDAHSLGLAPSEFLMLGGFRGSGKSVICANITANQYSLGNSTLYFSIEMRGREIFQRHIAILSGVSAERLKKNTLSEKELVSVAKTRAEMHVGGEKILDKYLLDKDFNAFEDTLLKLPMTPDSQIVIVDNQDLTIESMDATIQSYKTKFKDKLKIVVLDYINVLSCKDALDWKTQVTLAKRVKGLARKHDIAIIAPFQIDEKGGVRFSKGLLDAADWAYNLEAKDNSIAFDNIKSRGSAIMNFESEIAWDCLRISPHRNIMEEEPEDETDYEETSDDIAPWE